MSEAGAPPPKGDKWWLLGLAIVLVALWYFFGIVPNSCNVHDVGATC